MSITPKNNKESLGGDINSVCRSPQAGSEVCDLGVCPSIYSAPLVLPDAFSDTIKIDGKEQPGKAKQSQERPVLERLEALMKSHLGRDMFLKFLTYALKLMTLHCYGNKAREDRLRQLIASIVEGRMLFNHWRYFGSTKTLLKVYSKKPDSPTVADRARKVFLLLSLFFRVVEQLWGDVSYLQKFWMYDHNWADTKRISWHYKWNKSMSLTFSALGHLTKVVATEHQIRQLQYEQLKESVEIDFSDDDAQKRKIEMLEEMRTERNRCMLLCTKNCCDMVLKYRWISWYNPADRPQYLCGLFSGVVGVYLQWEGTSALLLKK